MRFVRGAALLAGFVISITPVAAQQTPRGLVEVRDEGLVLTQAGIAVLNRE